jgi:ankyrin repeat protein
MSIVTLLLDAGANLSSDDWGNTPISASIVKGHKNIVELLRAAEVNGWKRKRSS